MKKGNKGNLRNQIYKILQEDYDMDEPIDIPGQTPTPTTDDGTEGDSTEYSKGEILDGISVSIDDMLKDIDAHNSDGELDSIRQHLVEAQSEIANID